MRGERNSPGSMRPVGGHEHEAGLARRRAGAPRSRPAPGPCVANCTRGLASMSGAALNRWMSAGRGSDRRPTNRLDPARSRCRTPAGSCRPPPAPRSSFGKRPTVRPFATPSARAPHPARANSTISMAGRKCACGQQPVQGGVAQILVLQLSRRRHVVAGERAQAGRKIGAAGVGDPDLRRPGHDAKPGQDVPGHRRLVADVAAQDQVPPAGRPHQVRRHRLQRDPVRRGVQPGGERGERIDLGRLHAGGAGHRAGDRRQPAAGREVQHPAPGDAGGMVQHVPGQRLAAGPGECPERRLDAVPVQRFFRGLPDRGDGGREMQHDLRHQRRPAQDGVSRDERAGQNRPSSSAAATANPASRFSRNRRRQPAGSCMSSRTTCHSSSPAGSGSAA